jgi:hypothetical protein
MMTFTTYVPKARNDGSAVTRKEMNALRQGLREQFGGYTLEGDASGEWTDPATGNVYADRSLKVTVACHRERMHEAAEAVREIGRRLGQLAMWFEVKGADGVEILSLE